MLGAPDPGSKITARSCPIPRCRSESNDKICQVTGYQPSIRIRTCCIICRMRQKWQQSLAVLKRVVLVLFVLWLAMSAVLAYAMRQSPEKFGHFMSHMPVISFLVLPFETLWTDARAGRLEVGSPAPDFQLHTLDKSDSVQLSSFREKKPVVLVFGSYT